VAALGLLLPAGCNLPRDPEGTLERVENGTMRVGVTEADPWITLSGPEPAGLETELVRRFGRELGAEIEWVEGSEEALFEALELRELDLVIGGLSSTNPWSAMAAFTHPYVTTYATIGVPDGSEIPDDVAREEVAVETGSDLAGLVEKTDARPVEVEDIAEASGLAAVESWALDDLELQDSEIRLSETDHVMAVPLGENGWLVRLETWLLEHEAEIIDGVVGLSP
jgi:polar amino acid transport system substrate-binding protein